MNGVLPIVNEAPSGSPAKVPTIGTVLLMIVNCSPPAGVKPSDGVEFAPSQIDLAGHVELAVAGARGRPVEDDAVNRRLSAVVANGHELDVPLSVQNSGVRAITRTHVARADRDRSDSAGAAQGAIPGIAQVHRHACQRAVDLNRSRGRQYAEPVNV